MATDFTSAGTGMQGTGMPGGRGAPQPGESCTVKSSRQWGLSFFPSLELIKLPSIQFS